MSNTTLLSGHGGPASQQNDVVRLEHRPPPLRSAKIHPRHLERLAIVYVRQSTPQQIVDHRESGELQYNLAHRAVDLGCRPRFHAVRIATGHQCQQPAHQPREVIAVVRFGSADCGAVLGPERAPRVATAVGVQGVALKVSYVWWSHNLPFRR